MQKNNEVYCSDEPFIVNIENSIGDRLDIALSKELELTRSRVKKLIDGGGVLVNNTIVKSGYIICKNDIVCVEMPEETVCNAIPQDIPINIVYEDDYIAVINKEQGMVTHPSETTKDGTLVNALMFRMDKLSTINGVIRPGIVHRLDKDTSGLLVIAKNDIAHLSLQEQIATKEANRLYIALVDGNIKENNGYIEQTIGRSKKDRKLMAVDPNGRYAKTFFSVLCRYGCYTLTEYKLFTGRTHQIRVHSKYLNHPIVGDTAYGGSNKFNLNGQLLHAYKLTIRHPNTNEVMEFVAPLPPHFEKTLTKIEHLKK